jgi:hypothetical protein
MTMHLKTLGLAALALSVCTFAMVPMAHAQAPKPGAASVKTTDTSGAGDQKGYGYTFDDDPLNAGGFGPGDATIRVRPRAARTTLIRPRTSFVPEMLRSVENL